ncbi:hypothetical protein NDU88_006551 [Pleurodeles waltl]|uniref:DDE Tnp4 domain-containing protein n=1 Tax=Pleurodeles waltl TaxID=8319 RepID=A0AAV7UMU4_PLEWA|nr:hypothetical protein NDU88_006551 [Pleurodeles waltl]
MCCCDLCLEPNMVRVTGERAPATEGAASHRTQEADSTDAEGTSGTEGEGSTMAETGRDSSDTDTSSDGSSWVVADTSVTTPATGDSGYPNLSWLLAPVRNARTRAEECYNEAHGRTRRIIERTFGLLKARFWCLYLTGGSLCYSPKKVCQIIVACCMLQNLALRRHVPFLQEEEAGDACVAAVDAVDSEDEEAEDKDEDNRTAEIRQYFQ